MEFALSQPKWFDWRETSKKDISIELYAVNVTIGFDFGYDFDSEFATKWKASISIELKASKAIESDLGHDLER